MPGVVVIPAYNEARSIASTLATLLGDAGPGEFHVVVVCNGCTDDTASVARAAGALSECDVTVVELTEGNKAAALRYVEGLGLPYPRVYLDADVQCPTATVRELLDAVRGGLSLAVPTRALDLTAASRATAAYYRTWQSLPWVRHQLAGRGCYAVSDAMRPVFETLGDVVAEDRLVTMRAGSGDAVVVAAAVTIRPPARLADVVRVRSRVYGGNIAVDAPTHDEARGRRLAGLTRLLLDPSRWFGLAVFVAVTAAAKVRATYLVRRGRLTWGRDERRGHRVSGVDRGRAEPSDVAA